MAAARILISRELSADERAALAHHFGEPRIGSDGATRWAEALIRVALAELVTEHEDHLREQRRSEPTS